MDWFPFKSGQIHKTKSTGEELISSGGNLKKVKYVDVFITPYTYFI
jgi:hypothetical protein